MKKDGRKSTNVADKPAPFMAAQRASMSYGNRNQPVPTPNKKTPNAFDRVIQKNNAEALGMGDVGKKIEGAAARDRQKTKLQQRSRWPGSQQMQREIDRVNEKYSRKK